MVYRVPHIYLIKLADSPAIASIEGEIYSYFRVESSTGEILDEYDYITLNGKFRLDYSATKDAVRIYPPLGKTGLYYDDVFHVLYVDNPNRVEEELL